MVATEPRCWWRFALPWVVIALATDFFFDIDLLILSHFLDRESLAVFGVFAPGCSRWWLSESRRSDAVTLPEMFERNAAADRVGFLKQIGEANLVACAISVALFAIVVLTGPLLLMLFGPEFQAGVVPLAVLSSGTLRALAVRPGGFGAVDPRPPARDAARYRARYGRAGRSQYPA